jgi:hypothetical protein
MRIHCQLRREKLPLLYHDRTDQAKTYDQEYNFSFHFESQAAMATPLIWTHEVRQPVEVIAFGFQVKGTLGHIRGGLPVMHGLTAGIHRRQAGLWVRVLRS